jgi:metaxin
MAVGDSDWFSAELYCPYQRKAYNSFYRIAFLDEQALLYEFADCVATRAFLKLVNLPFSIEQRPNAEHMSPNGVVPFLRLQSTLTSGFWNIVELVGQKVREKEKLLRFTFFQGIKLTNTLSASEVTDMLALMSLIKENLIKAEVGVFK